MQIHFHSFLCTYLPRVPILLTMTVYERTRYAFVLLGSHPLTPAPIFCLFRYLWSMGHLYITQTAQEFVWKRTETHLFWGVSFHTFSYKCKEFFFNQTKLAKCKHSQKQIQDETKKAP